MHGKIDEEKFRVNFKNMDDSVMLGYEHVAALTWTTVAAARQAGSQGKLPHPVIKSNKLVRWTVGQIRAWVNGLSQEAARKVAEAAAHKQQIDSVLGIEAPKEQVRMGRPRSQGGAA